MKIVPISGRYYRVADVHWVDPLDPTYAARNSKQRWNPEGIPCLYLNWDVSTARSNVLKRLEGQPYGPEDLDPAAGPVLIEVDIPEGHAADAFTDDGLVSLGLPPTYPVDINDIPVPREDCQQVGQRVFDANLDGIDNRSAAPGGIRELAWFPRDSHPTQVSAHPFDEWW